MRRIAIIGAEINGITTAYCLMWRGPLGRKCMASQAGFAAYERRIPFSPSPAMAAGHLHALST